MRDARRLQVPALVLQGGRDQMVYPEGAEALVAAAPKQWVRFEKLENAWHEVFNDLDRGPAIQAVVTWLDQVLRRR